MNTTQIVINIINITSTNYTVNTPEIQISFPRQVQTSSHNESGRSGKKKLQHTLFLVPKARYEVDRKRNDRKAPLYSLK